MIISTPSPLNWFTMGVKNHANEPYTDFPAQIQGLLIKEAFVALFRAIYRTRQRGNAGGRNSALPRISRNQSAPFPGDFSPSHRCSGEIIARNQGFILTEMEQENSPNPRGPGLHIRHIQYRGRHKTTIWARFVEKCCTGPSPVC